MRCLPWKAVGCGFVIAWAVALGFVSFGIEPATALGPRVDICHFQRAKGSWKLKSQGQRAAATHLENHDDALPGGTTSQTGTDLNANCDEVVPCPCEGLTLMGSTWDDSWDTAACLRIDSDLLLTDARILPGAELLAARSGRSAECFLQLIGSEVAIGFRDISEAEVAACEDSLRQIAANDGVSCE